MLSSCPAHYVSLFAYPLSLHIYLEWKVNSNSLIERVFRRMNGLFSDPVSEKGCRFPGNLLIYKVSHNFI